MTLETRTELELHCCVISHVSELWLSLQHASTAYGPAVIKELLNEAIETGHGHEVRHNIAKHIFTSAPQHLAKTTVVSDSQSQRRAVGEDCISSGVKRSCQTAAAPSATTTLNDSADCAQSGGDVDTRQGDVLALADHCM